MFSWQEFVEVLPFLRNALIAGALAGSLAPVIGGYFVLRRIVLLGVTVPQVSSVGIAFALLLQGFGWLGLGANHGEDGQAGLMAGALIFTVGGILILGTVVSRKPGLADVSIGFVFAVSSAMSILLLSQNPVGEAHMLNLLKGEVIATTDRDLIGTSLFYVAIIASLVIFHKEFLLVSYDRDFAVSLGKPVARYDLFFYVVAGCAVSVCVLTVGPVTTFGYLVLAPLVALLITRGMTFFFLGAALIGAVASVTGLLAGFFLDLPVGPATVALLALVYAIVWVLRRFTVSLVAWRSGGGRPGCL